MPPAHVARAGLRLWGTEIRGNRTAKWQGLQEANKSKDGVQSERLVTEEVGESKQIQEHAQERFPEGAAQSGETFMTPSQMIRERSPKCCFYLPSPA